MIHLSVTSERSWHSFRGDKGENMKTDRHARILELIQEKEIETQDDLVRILKEEGYNVTQATVSRDIRQLKLTKISMPNGRQKYAGIQHENAFAEKYIRILKDAFISAEAAQNLLVMRTAPGMAATAAAALDAMKLQGFLGCVAGDDTVIVVAKTCDDAERLLKQIKDLAH